MHRRFNGWIRAAIVFTVFWVVILSALAIYEHAATGPWDYFGHNHGLLFHTWAKDPMDRQNTHRRVQRFICQMFHARRFWLWFILPIVVVWLFCAALVPSIRWVRGCPGPSAMRWSEPPAAVLFTFQMTKPLSIFTTLALGGRRPSCSRYDLQPTPGILSIDACGQHYRRVGRWCLCGVGRAWTIFDGARRRRKKK